MEPESQQAEPETYYATWRDVADAVESGKLAGEGFLPSGTGAATNPYIIKTPEAFAWYACLRPQAAARLAADIDLTSATYAEGRACPVWPGDAALSGSLDGDGHAVLFFTAGAGLFAEITETGSVSWLCLGFTDRQSDEAAAAGKPATAVSTAGALAGALAGTNKGKVTGVVNRMGVNVIDDSDAPASPALAGGIVAANDGKISDCANLGDVANVREAEGSTAAGIAAAGSGTVETSYSAGSVNALAVRPLADPVSLDAASAYLSGTEESEDEPSALDATALAAAFGRLNAGREGDASVWAAGGEATRGLPAPTKPKNPGANLVTDTVEAAQPAPTLKSETVETEPVNGEGEPLPTTLVASWQVPDASQYAYAPFVVESSEVQGRQLAVAGAEALSDMTAEEAANMLLPKELAVNVLEEAVEGYSSEDSSQSGEATETVPVTWASEDYDQSSVATQGATFTAQLPKGYRLVEGAMPLDITVVPDDQANEAAATAVESWRMPTEEEGYDLASAVEATDEGAVLNLTDLSALAGMTAEEAAAALLPAQVYATVEAPADPAGESGALPTTVTSESHIYDSANPASDRGAAAAETREVALDVAWTATSYRDPQANGATFAAQLPEGYQLAVGAAPLVVTVPPSGAATLADGTYASWEDVAKAVEDGTIGVPSAGSSVKPLNFDEPEAGSTSDFPLWIDSPEALAWWAYMANQPDGERYRNAHVRLKEDIDLTGSGYGNYAVGTATDGTQYATCLPWTPVDAFSGSFEGAGHRLTSLYVNEVEGATRAGLFRTVTGPGAEVKNLTVASGYVHGAMHGSAETYIGAIVGSIEGNGGTARLTNCSNAARVQTEKACVGDGGPANEYAGGIAGCADGTTIELCSNSGTVWGKNRNGGVVGRALNMTIGSCSNTGQVFGSWAAGGIVGQHAHAGSIRNSYNSGTITRINESPHYYHGGILGAFSSDSNCVIDSCYNAGSVTGNPIYARVANNASDVNCLYLQGKATNDNDDAATKVTAAQLQSWGAAYQLNGGAVGGDGSGNVSSMTAWRMDAAGENGGYPVLVKPAPDGTPAAETMQPAADWSQVGAWVEGFDPKDAEGNEIKPAQSGADAANAVRLATPEAFAWFAYKVNVDKSYALCAVVEDGAVLDLLGAAYTGSSADPAAAGAADALTWVPVGELLNGGPSYAGRFDGSNGTGALVDHLYIDAPDKDYRGLFGYVTDNGSITGVSVGSRSSVTGTGFVGGVVASFTGDAISRCSNAAAVRSVGGSRSYIGGVAGSSLGGIYDCCNTGAVTLGGTGVAGGVAGIGDATVASCYNAGPVTGPSGSILGAIANADSSFENCFFDPDASGDAKRANGTYDDETAYPATKATAAEFATGEVAWLLDHPDAHGDRTASAATAGSGSGFWGQKLVQSTLLGGLDTSPLAGGDPYPVPATPAGAASEHPAVLRVDYNFAGLAAPDIKAANLFLNEGGTVPLATSPIQKMVYCSDAALTDPVSNPYRTAGVAPVNGYYPLYAKTVSDWGDVGALQTEASLKATYWDAGSRAWLKASDAADVPDGLAALEGDLASGFTVRSEEALAWFAHAANNGYAYVYANLTLEALEGHPVFDLSGSAYGGAVRLATGSDADRYADCLPWRSLGSYGATMRATGTALENLYAVGDTGSSLVSEGFGGTLSFVDVDVASGYVEGYNAAALVGYTDYSPEEGLAFTNCRNGATIQGQENAGGLGALLSGTVRFSGCSNEGAVSAKEGSSPTAGGLAASTYENAIVTVSSCMNAGAVSGDAVSAGLVAARPASCTVEGSLSVGQVSGGAAYAFASTTSDGTPAAVSDSYCLDTIGGSQELVDAASNPNAAKSAEQLRTWGAAYALNGGAAGGSDGSGNVSAMDAWRMADDADQNSGFPVLVGLAGEGVEQDGTTPASTMQKALDWSQVGAWVDDFDPKDAEGAAFKPDASAGDGSTEANAVEIATPEALAWFAYRVNSDAASRGLCARVADGVVLDLLGAAYAGSSAEPATAVASDALTWVPIGYSSAPGNPTSYEGTFEGSNATGALVDHLYIDEPDKEYAGMFGHVTIGAAVAGVSVGSRSSVTGLYYVSGVVAALSGSLTRCSNAGAVHSTHPYMGTAGGVVGNTNQSVSDCFNTGAVSAEGTSSAGGIAGNVGDVSSCYNAGPVTGPSTARLSAIAYGTGQHFNCFYDPEASGDAKQSNALRDDQVVLSSKATAAEFATGQVAWLLNHPDAHGDYAAAASAAGAGSGVWGQRIVRSDLDGALVTDPLSGGDAYPAFAGAGSAPDNPAVLRMDYRFEGLAPAIGAANLFLNEGSAIALAAGPSQKMVCYSDAAYTMRVASPYRTADASPVDGYYTLYARAFSTWEDVGALQTEDALKATYWDAAAGSWAKAADAADVPADLTALSGDLASGFTVRSEEALAWFAYAVNNGVGDVSGDEYARTDLTLEALEGHPVFDLSGSAYGGSVDADADSDADKYAQCLPWKALSTYGATMTGTGTALENLYVPEEQGSALVGKGIAGSELSFVGMDVASGFLEGSNAAALLNFSGSDTATVAFTNCRNAAAIHAYLNAGGLCAVAAGTVRFSGCSNEGSLSVSVDYSSTTITRCVAGGLTGNGGGASITVSSCVNSGPVQAGPRSAGLVGGNYDSCTVEGSLSLGQVTALGNNGGSEAYAFAWPTSDGSPAAVSDSYYLDTIGGSAELVDAASNPGASKTDEQLRTWGAAYQLNGGSDGGSDGSGGVSGMDAWTWDGSGYPSLVGRDASGAADGHMAAATDWVDVGRWVDNFEPEDASGTVLKPVTADGAIQVSTAEGLAWYAYQVVQDNRTYGSSRVELAEGFSLAGNRYTGSDEKLNWFPIGVSSRPFSGIFEGNGNRLTDLRVDSVRNCQGLFGTVAGTLEKKAVVRGFELSGSVRSASSSVGGVAGQVYLAEIGDVAFAGDVTSLGGGAGGIAWFVSHETALENVAFVGDVHGEGDQVGGIVGLSTTDSSIKNAYAAGSVTVSSGSTRPDRGALVGEASETSLTNCYWDSSKTGLAAIGESGDGNASADVSAKSADQFATGEVAWLLNHPDAHGDCAAPSSTAGAGSGVWGQKIVRSDLDGALVADPLARGDAYPALSTGDDAASAHPAVARVDYDFSALEAAAPVPDASLLFLNEGSVVKLAAPESPLERWAYYADAELTKQVRNPYDTSAPGAVKTAEGYYPVHVKGSLIGWADVGGMQDEGRLRLTYWDDGSGAWETAADASGVPENRAALEGSAAEGLVIRSEDALAWFAFQVNHGADGYKTADVVLAPAGGHTAFDLSGAAYGGSVDGTAAAEDEARYSGCLKWDPIDQWSGELRAYGTRVENLYVAGKTADEFGGFVYENSRAGLFGDAQGTAGQTFLGLDVASGYVEGGEHVAGVIAYAGGSVEFRDCRNAAAVRGGTVRAGGLCGETGGDARFSRCSNEGSVIVKSSQLSMVGGLLGMPAGGSSVAVSSCLNAGELYGSYPMAGLVAGSPRVCTVEGSLSVGKVGTMGIAVNAFSSDSSTVSNSYYLDTIGGSYGVREDEYNPGASKTEDQLRSWGAAYQLNAGASGGAIAGSGDVSGMDAWTWDGSGYPSLVERDASGAATGHMANAADWGAVGRWVEDFDPAAADGAAKLKPGLQEGSGDHAASTPIVLSSPEALAWYADRVNNANGAHVFGDSGAVFGDSAAKIASDLPLPGSLSLAGAKYTDDAAGLAWVPIGTSGTPYSGGFDGNGKAIVGMRVNGSTANQGLFGYAVKGSVADAGYIKDLSLSGSVASSSTDTNGANIGGLVGYGEDITVSDIQANVDVDARGMNAGGVVGKAKGMVVERTSHTGAIASTLSDVGGVFGYADGLTLRDSFHEGSVEGSTRVGGLGGSAYNGTAFANSYASAAVNTPSGGIKNAVLATGSATLKNCYYNTDLCGTGKTGSTGKAAAEFVSGEVAWLLDTADADGSPFDEAAAAADPASRGVWGQKIARDAAGDLAYDPGNPSAYAGDACPRFWDGDASGGVYADGTAHPRVAKVAYLLHEPDFPSGVAPQGSYANNGGALKLAVPDAAGGKPCWYWLDGVDGTAIPGSPWKVGESPSTGAAEGTAYYAVTIATSVGSWDAVGARQIEDDLRRADASGPAPLSGAGSEDDPFVLSTPEAFAWFAHKVNADGTQAIANSDGTDGGLVFEGTANEKPRPYASACAELGANIDLFGTQATGSAQDYIDASTPRTVENALRWTPVGANGGSYKAAAFNGVGKEIDYLNVVSPDFTIGLFGVVHGCTIEGVNVAGNSQVRSSVDGDAVAGGIAGMAANATIDGCTYGGLVSASVAGGIVGYFSDSDRLAPGVFNSMANCSSTATVEGMCAGGLVGGFMNEKPVGDVVLEKSFNRGSVTSSGMAGGLVGMAATGTPMKVSECYSTGSVGGGPAQVPGPDDGVPVGIGGLVGGVMSYPDGELSIERSYAAPQAFSPNANVPDDSRGALVGGYTARYERTTISLDGCRYENGSGTPLDGAGAVGSSCLAFVAGGTVTDAMAKGVPTAGLQDWAAAYAMNGDAYAGDAAGTSATAWTTDAGGANRGYLVFGDLKATPVSATLDPDDMAGTSDGTVVAPLLNGLVPVTFAGPVQVVEGAAFSSDDAGATAPDLAENASGVGSIKDAYTTRGTTNAAAMIALQLVDRDAVAGAADNPAVLAGSLAAGDVLGAAGDSFSGVSLNAAAAYDRADALTYTALLAAGRYGYAVEVSVDGRDRLTAQVDVPVDAETFELEPDGTVKTADAADKSIVQNKGIAPVAGGISAVEALPAGEHQVGYDANGDGFVDADDLFTVTDVLLPTAGGASPLAPSSDPVDGGLVRLGLKDCALLDPSKLPLYFVPGADGAGGTIPLTFALPGTVGSPTQLAYRYFMDYTGTYVPKPGTTQGAFGYKVSYDIALSADDVDAAQAGSATP